MPAKVSPDLTAEFKYATLILDRLTMAVLSERIEVHAPERGDVYTKACGRLSVRPNPESA